MVFFLIQNLNIVFLYHFDERKLSLVFLIRIFPTSYVNNIPKKVNQAKTPEKWGKKRLRIFP